MKKNTSPVYYEIDGATVATERHLFYKCSVYVFDFPYQQTCNNHEHEIIAMEDYNRGLEKFRIKMFCSDWWWSIDLPYKALPDTGLVVIFALPLDEEITFECPWDYPKNGYNQSPTARDFFCPAVPLDFRPSYYDNDFIKGSDGFLKDSFLLWHWDFSDDD